MMLPRNTDPCYVVTPIHDWVASLALSVKKTRGRTVVRGGNKRRPPETIGGITAAARFGPCDAASVFGGWPSPNPRLRRRALRRYNLASSWRGRIAWPSARASKSRRGSHSSWVRIPPPPPGGNRPGRVQRPGLFVSATSEGRFVRIPSFTRPERRQVGLPAGGPCRRRPGAGGGRRRARTGWQALHRDTYGGAVGIHAQRRHRRPGLQQGR
jgi:hypothetical protein